MTTSSHLPPGEFHRAPGSLAEQLAFVEWLESVDTPGCLRLAAEHRLDIARCNPNDTELVDHSLRQAGDNVDRAISRYDSTAITFTDWFRSQKLRTMLPLYRAFVTEGEAASPADNYSAYTQLTALGLQQADTVKKYYAHPELNDLRGDLAELGIYLLLLRQSMKMGSETWFPLPAFRSEDCQPLLFDGQPVRQSWDISVYTKHSQQSPACLTYKVQVKASPHFELAYTDDVTVVYLSDLQLDDHRKCGVHTIPEECFAELYRGDPRRYSQQLDERTDKLLEILG